jgi:hypothetical protein
VLPTLFHLLWRGVLVADLESRVLGDDTVVTAQCRFAPSHGTAMTKSRPFVLKPRIDSADAMRGISTGSANGSPTTMQHDSDRHASIEPIHA